MSVIVDTPIWSLAMRRDNCEKNEIVKELQKIILNHQAHILGPIRQEILSGIRNQEQFERLKKHLECFPDLAITTDDYVKAAHFFNVCRTQGIQGSHTDFLICSIAEKYGYSIFTTDRDFVLYVQHLPITLHKI